MAEEPETPDEQPGEEQPAEPEAPAEGTPDAEPAPQPEGPIHEAAGEEGAPAAEDAATEEPAAEEGAADEEPSVEQPAAEGPAPAEEPAGAEGAAAPGGEAPPAGEPAPESEEAPPARAKPEIPGADLEVDIVPEGMDPLARAEAEEAAALAEVEEAEAPIVEQVVEEDEDETARPVAQVAIDLGADARYKATGKRKTAVARVVLKPGSGDYRINGRPLEAHFPRPTLQRNIRQPLETVGYESRMDVVATLHGGGVSAQAGALRHGISRALIEADPNLRSELKRRGFLTRDPRVKERKKAGLKKARKRPQFSKR